MSPPKRCEWDPTVLGTPMDQIGLYDETRRRCPVAFSELFGWSLFGHEEVTRALADPATFSSRVSQHLAVPNGMDPPEHGVFRQLIDPYFSAERMAEFEPVCRAIAAELVERLPTGQPVDCVAELAEPYAIRAQCAFLQWPDRLREPLREWVGKNHAAIRNRDRQALADVAFEFDAHIRGVLSAHRSGRADLAGGTVARLLAERVAGRPLSDEEIVSILRNWTVGELATIAASVGIVAHFLAVQPELQSRLRAEDALLSRAIDEILRLRAPLMTARRVVAQPVEIAGQRLAPGSRVTLMWAAANRDEETFAAAGEFDLDRDPDKNLLYGAGIHVCPGAPLARLELRVLFAALLARLELRAPTDRQPVHAIYPAAGFSHCPLIADRIDAASDDTPEEQRGREQSDLGRLP